MNIILYKDTLYGAKQLYDEVDSYNFLDGIILSATMTKDDKIIVYNFLYNPYASVQSIQKESYNELKANVFYEISEFFEIFKNYKGKLIINLHGVPNIIGHPNRNYKFVLKLRDIIKKYNQINLYICSSYDDVITYIIKELENIKKGMVVFEGNLNYYDVDYYVVPSRMFDTKIVAQQLKLNKEIMLTLESTEEIISIIDKFKENYYLFDGMSKKQTEDLLHIVTKSPKVMDIVLSSKKN